MGIVSAIRTGSVNILSRLESSQRPGTFLNLLVRTLNPEPYLRSSVSDVQGRKPRFIPLKARETSKVRAELQVQHLEDRLKQKSTGPGLDPNLVVNTAVKLIKQDQALEARLLLRDALQVNKLHTDLDKAFTALSYAYLKQNNLGDASRQQLSAELQAAYRMVKEPGEQLPELDVKENVAYMARKLNQAEEWARLSYGGSLPEELFADNYGNAHTLDHPHKLQNGVINLVADGQPYHARKLMEQYFRHITNPMQREIMRRNIIDSVREQQQTFYTLLEDSLACDIAVAQIDRAYKNVNGRPDPELSEEWHRQQPNRELRPGKILPQYLKDYQARQNKSAP